MKPEDIEKTIEKAYSEEVIRMPKLKQTIDRRSILLREAEARRGCRNHAELAKVSGMKPSTLRKRMILPGTATLDEIQAICGGMLTADEALELIGGKR